MQVMSTPTTKVTLGFSDKDHPFWGIAKPVIQTCCVAFLLRVFAEDFDATEVKTIVGTLLGSFGLELFNVRDKKR